MKKFLFIALIAIFSSCCGNINTAYATDNNYYYGEFPPSQKAQKCIKKVNAEIEYILSKYSDNKVIVYYLGDTIVIDSTMDKVHIINFIISKFEERGYKLYKIAEHNTYYFIKNFVD